MTIDKIEIVRAMGLILEPGQVTELRALDVVTPDYRRPHVVSGYFDDPAKLAQAAAKIGQAKGVYFIPNPVAPALLARACNRARPAEKEPLTGDADIVERRWLLLDLDPTRPAGISSSDVEHTAALAKARTVRDALWGEEWGDPILADSGNGGHLLYRVELPTDDKGLVQKVLAALAAKFSDAAVTVDTSVFNPARIWKLYGTWACKGDNTPDRPHRMARIIDVPDKMEGGALCPPVPLDLLKIMAAEAPADPKQAGKGPATVATSRKLSQAVNGVAFDIEGWMRQHLPDAIGPEPWQGGRRWRIDCPWNTDHKGSGFVLHLASGAYSAGCLHDSCRHRTWQDLRAMKEPGCYDRPAHTPTASGSDAEGEAEPTPEILSAGTLLADYPQLRPPVIHGLLRQSETANVISQAKIGKTILAIGMGLCIRTGRAWLNTFQVERGNVLYIDAELHKATFSRRLHSVAQAMGILTDEFRDGFDVLPLRGQLRDIMRLAPVFRDIATGKYKVIFLDALYRLLPPDCEENSNSDMAKVFNQIDIYAEWTGAAIVVIHHSSKGNQSGKSVVDVGSGASAQARAVDCHLILREHKEDGCVVLDAAARSWPPPAPMVLRWQYPVWTTEPDLDPEDLKQPGPRRGKAKTEPEPAEPTVTWDATKFADAFVGPNPVLRATIIAQAREQGIGKAAAENLIRLGLASGRIHAWRLPKTTAVYLANKPKEVTP